MFYKEYWKTLQNRCWRGQDQDHKTELNFPKPICPQNWRGRVRQHYWWFSVETSPQYIPARHVSILSEAVCEGSQQWRFQGLPSATNRDGAAVAIPSTETLLCTHHVWTGMSSLLFFVSWIIMDKLCLSKFPMQNLHWLYLKVINK